MINKAETTIPDDRTERVIPPQFAHVFLGIIAQTRSWDEFVADVHVYLDSGDWMCMGGAALLTIFCLSIAPKSKKK